MANKYERNESNQFGKFYVDAECIVCDACVLIAPDNFEMNDEYAFVKKQPESQEEIELCIEAMEGCPVESIGDDGDTPTPSPEV